MGKIPINLYMTKRIVMLDKEHTTILKRNEIIRGHSDELDVFAIRALNAIYWGIQKHKLHDEPIAVFKFSTLRKLMKLETNKDYVAIIKKALEDLMKTITLRNYCHTDGVEYKWFTTRFINEARIRKDDITTVEIAFNPTMNELLKIHENFTKLEFLKYSNTFRSKYTVALYEYLKSFESYKYIDMSMESLNGLLGTNAKYFSKLVEVIDRCMNDITTKSDLKHIKKRAYKKEKYIRFYLNPNGNKNSVKKLLKADQLFTTF